MCRSNESNVPMPLDGDGRRAGLAAAELAARRVRRDLDPAFLAQVVHDAVVVLERLALVYLRPRDHEHAVAAVRWQRRPGPNRGPEGGHAEGESHEHENDEHHDDREDEDRHTLTVSRVKFGIQVGHLGGPLDELRRLWRFADDRGFEWFSVSDHFQETPGRGGGEPCLESVTTLTAAALETKRVRVGCLVFCVSYRQPIVLAKALTAIDLLSNGRVTCGLGAGWHEPEYQAYGIEVPRAGTREDQLE